MPLSSTQNGDDEANHEFTQEIAAIEKDIRAVKAADASRDAFLRFCELALVDISAVWRQADEEQRRRVRQILFTEGILVSADRKLSNPDNSPLFNVLAGMMGKV